ncbi:uncharacterized protein PpBr36_10785 [Pyricularia pennisetigena]|uniref:uncharacterized protein n=1 Tax=Pyricularia pennisetigena TaxID=1578925 RepID=UPI00115077A2|nr:uncharacterized protein PpBr36_10785 [Pyricularia pennisetigena]TLS20851.1 hypothetical protein PpBr36_10785 [Pyricularia pennisetigena]
MACKDGQLAVGAVGQQHRSHYVREYGGRHAGVGSKYGALAPISMVLGEVEELQPGPAEKQD